MVSNSDFSQNQAYYMQYTGTPVQGHEEYIQTIASPESQKPKPHINPNFINQSQNPKPSVHINPKFHNCPSSKRPDSSSSAQPRNDPAAACPKSGNVHINPKFRGSPTGSPVKGPPASPGGADGRVVHVNPRFANRPLPSLPADESGAEPGRAEEPVYANLEHKVNFDHKKTDEFVQNIKSTYQNQVVMRNKYKKDNRVKPPEKPVRHSIIDKPNRYSLIVDKPKRNSVYVVENIASATPTCVTPARKTEEKENVPSSSKKSFLFTPLRKTPFKKIGSRKLIRCKKKSLSPGTPRPSFKRIGNNKLIRIRESLTSDTKSTPLKVYSIKTKTKIVKAVKNTPTNNSKYRFSFITPLSMRKNKLVRRTLGSRSNPSVEKKPRFTDRFRLDRRQKKEKPPIKKTSHTRLKKLSGSTYHVSATKLQRVSSPSKPARTKNLNVYRPKATAVNPNLAPNKVISVQGVKFTVAENGKKLKRLSESDPTARVTYSASVSHTSASQTTSPVLSQTSPSLRPSPGKEQRRSPLNTSPAQVRMKRTYIGGEEFDEIEPGVFTRSRHSLTRQSITNAKNRSINTILKVQNRSKQYCMFYNKFGKCTKKEKGSCPYIHDTEKIAVCRRFLQGACTKDKCLLSHKLEPEKMPACKFFLEGVCTRENCPYLHVKVNDKAGVCERFLKGFCPNGADCSQRHVIACPEYDRTGSCSREGKCVFPHINRGEADNGATKFAKKKTAPPAKPKRKSLGQSSEHNLKKSRVTARYFDDQTEAQEEQADDNLANTEADDLEEKRKRLLKKVEIAKQAWRVDMGAVEVEQEANERSLNDSGPYEKVDESSLESPKQTIVDSSAQPSTGKLDRPPIGTLSDFISLECGSSEDDTKDDRLI